VHPANRGDVHGYALAGLPVERGDRRAHGTAPLKQKNPAVAGGAQNESATLRAQWHYVARWRRLAPHHQLAADHLAGQLGDLRDETRRTGLWNMDSGLAAARRPGMTI
jgi:hypothetical protein